MQEKKIEFEKVIVRVKYKRALTKDDIEESCVRFLKQAMQDNEKQKKDPNASMSRCTRNKQVLDKQA